jgi:hypothetical protein
MKASLKELAGRAGTSELASATAPKAEHRNGGASYKTAQTRIETRQVSGHFKPEVAQTLRLIAVEQDKEIQEVLAEALNMLFARYGKATRAMVTSGRRKKATS